MTNKTIYKYPLQVTDLQSVSLPEGWKFVHVGLDPDGELALWAWVNPETPLSVQVIVNIFGTGNPIPPLASDETYEHLGSVVQGPFMWHVFQTTPLELPKGQ